MSRFRRLLLAVAFLAAPVSARADTGVTHQIAIDVGAFLGEWAIQHVEKPDQDLQSNTKDCKLNEKENEWQVETPANRYPARVSEEEQPKPALPLYHYEGSCHFELAEGQYVMSMHSNHGQKPAFAVDAIGQVTVLGDPKYPLAIGGDKRLSLTTEDFKVCLGAFEGSFGFERVGDVTDVDESSVGGCKRLKTWSLPRSFVYLTSYSWFARAGGTTYFLRPDLASFDSISEHFTLNFLDIKLKPVGTTKPIEWSLRVDGDDKGKYGKRIGEATVTTVRNVILKLTASSGTVEESRYLTIVNGCDISAGKGGLGFDLGLENTVKFEAQVICR